MTRPTLLFALPLLISHAPTRAQDMIFPSWSGETGDNPTHSVQADFDDDGLVDVAVMGRSDQAIQIWLGSASGQLVESRVLEFQGVGNELAMGDLNGDGRPDLVTTSNLIPLSLNVFLGMAGGDFGAALKTTVQAAFNGGLAIADVDHDGQLDVLLTDNTVDAIIVLPGNGNGTFADPVLVPSVSVPRGVTAGDLNGDGVVDLVFGDAGADAIAVQLGLGGGSFGPSTPYSVFEEPSRLQLVDLDQDGALDVLAVITQTDTVALLYGVGDGTLEGPILISTPGLPRDMCASDLDADGELDLAVVCNSANLCRLYYGMGGRRFSDATRVPAPWGSESIEVGNFDGIGPPDLVMTGTIRDQIVWRAGQGPAANWQTVAMAGSRPQGLEVGDLDGDGHLDVVVAISGADRIGLFYGDGVGGLAPVVHLTAQAAPGDPNEIELADFDDDGRLDIAVSHRSFSASESLAIAVHLQLPGGDFAAPIFETAVDDPWDLRAADLDADGHMDLLVPNRNGDDVSVLLGNGDGSFEAQPRVPLGDLPADLAIGDFDGDGTPDFVVILDVSSNMVAFLGNGDGSFTHSDTVGINGGSGTTCSIGDVNLDGIPDLLGQAGASSLLRYFLGNGDGTFGGLNQFFLNGFGAGETFLTDLNGDCVPDVVVAQGEQLQVLVGTGGGAYAPARTYASGAGANFAKLADMDEDGWPDLVHSISQSRTIAIQPNLGMGRACIGESFCGFSINSTGSAATIRALGSTSVAAQDVELTASNLPIGQFGIFFFAGGSGQVPLGNGYQCAIAGGGGLFRLPVTVSDAGGALRQVLDFGLPAVGLNLIPGTSWNFQAWFRDPAAGGAAFNLSDGLRIPFGL